MPIHITVQTSGGGPLLDFDFNPEASFPPPPGGQVEQEVHLLWFDEVMTPKNYSALPATGPLAYPSELGTLQKVAWRVKYTPAPASPYTITVGFAFLRTGVKSPVTCFCIPKGQDLYLPPSPATFVQVGWVSA